MEHHNQGIKRKRQRQFRTSVSTVGAALIVVGFAFLTALCVFYPQKYLRDVFDARLSYHLVMDKDDYLTCGKDYRNFIYDEPNREEALVSFYVFNVTNPSDVVTRGYKPIIRQLGPYAFQKSTYKYNITFDPNDDTKMSFKEYVRYTDIPMGDLHDRETCRRMYYRMGRGTLAFTDPCLTGTCNCFDANRTVTVANPSFLRTLKEEGAGQIMARLAEEQFADIRTLLEVDFVRATKAHVVYHGLAEVFQFRQFMQVGALLNTSFTQYYRNYSIDALAGKLNSTARNITILNNCGLQRFYNATGCPVTLLFYSFRYIKSPYVTSYPTSIPESKLKNSDFPDLKPLLDPNQPLSFLNLKVGLPIWIGLTFYLQILDYNYGQGYTMVSKGQLEVYHNQITDLLAIPYFGRNYNFQQRFCTQVVIKSVAYWLTRYWINPYLNVLRRMVYDEWITTSSPVICTPRGNLCTWQLGYMSTYRGNTYQFTTNEVESIIDIQAIGINNPNQPVWEGNTAAYYNAYTYCSKVYFPRLTDLHCVDYNYTVYDATVRVPGSLWALNQGLDLLNKTNYLGLYERTTNDSTKMTYFLLGCNLSTLHYEVYASQVGYHDQFVVHYLNKNRDPKFNHTFSVGKWSELSWAQFGGGFVTYALLNVRSYFNVIRNGMWRFGHEKYYSVMMEYGSWAVYQGFPNLIIYNVTEARELLYALARRDEVGMSFRRLVVDRGTTLEGDGTNFVHGVGAPGERAYIPEWPYADFTCAGTEVAGACQVLSYSNMSSATGCEHIMSIYNLCLYKLYYDVSRWVTNCARFVTSIVDPTNGIQCDLKTVRGHAHPYLNQRGNIVYAMIQAYVFDLKIKRGLWCDPDIDPGSAVITGSTGLQSSSFSLETATCRFDWGGLFTTTTVNNLLFSGYTDPSVLKYLNLKHEHDGFMFECAVNAYDTCGNQKFHCDDHGLVLRYKNGTASLPLNYETTRRDQFFAPHFIQTDAGELLWPHSIHVHEQLHARSVMASGRRYSMTRNPIYAMFPAINVDDKDFNKLWQGQSRVLNGAPGLFPSDKDTLNTGRLAYVEALNIEKFKGNSSILLTASAVNVTLMRVRGATHTNAMQHPMGLWRAFQNYSYWWNFHLSGPSRMRTDVISLFHKQFGLQFELYQKSISPASNQFVTITVPFTHTWCYYLLNDAQCDRRGLTKMLNITTRRFVEDTDTYDNLRKLSVPVDSYGMPYRTPRGMISIDNLAGFPVFIGTPNNYGNQLWGGLEYTQTVGGLSLTETEFTQNTYVDYEPVTGRALRSAFRHQINIRAEIGPMLVSIATAQLECAPPSKIYMQTEPNVPAGYGCWAFVPLVWFEDARVVNTEWFYRYHDHFYTRVDRGKFLITWGMIFGLVFIAVGSCILIRENKLRRDFEGRIYVD